MLDAKTPCRTVRLISHDADISACVNHHGAFSHAFRKSCRLMKGILFCDTAQVERHSFLFQKHGSLTDFYMPVINEDLCLLYLFLIGNPFVFPADIP